MYAELAILSIFVFGYSILAGGPVTIRQTKALLRDIHQPGSRRTHSSLMDWHHAARHSQEAHEGLSAFVEKRPPNWP